ncbi:MAG: hypothetical protein EXQ52_17735 [Bryobacterales bacterium]|nr:hypothetical protein [Bryobacterales bacterium]
MRWGELTLVEHDPPKLDVQYRRDYFKRRHCDAVTLSSGGVVAFYPSRRPCTTAAHSSAIGTVSAICAAAVRRWAWSCFLASFRMPPTKTRAGRIRNGYLSMSRRNRVPA